MFDRVDPRHAGATALAILIPHGERTLVIVRPRALAFDLLPARWNEVESSAPAFCAFTRDEAANIARRFVASLESAVASGVNPVQTFGDAERECFQIWLRAADFVWIACRRAPGQAYQPLVFATQAEATQAGEELTRCVWPAAEVRQEYCFNTQNLS